jgi:hypothetical protein
MVGSTCTLVLYFAFLVQIQLDIDVLIECCAMQHAAPFALDELKCFGSVVQINWDDSHNKSDVCMLDISQKVLPYGMFLM